MRSFQRPSPHRRAPAAGGFTLIELMVAVAVVGILALIAFPSYSEQILRGRLTDATNGLSVLQVRMEQYYLDSRTYIDGPCATPTKSGTFTIACSSLTAHDYTVTATGTGPTAGFVYTVDATGDLHTTALPASWGSVPSGGYPCWVTRKGQTC